MVDFFHSYVNVHQRVMWYWHWHRYWPLCLCRTLHVPHGVAGVWPGSVWQVCEKKVEYYLSNFKSNALCGGTVLKNDGTVMGAVRWVRWYGTVGTVGTVRWVRRVRYGRYGGLRWVRYGGYGTVGTVGAYLHPPYRTHRIPPCAVPTVPTVPYLAYPAYHTHRTHRTHLTVPTVPRDRTSVPRLCTHRTVPIESVICTYPCWIIMLFIPLEIR